MQSPRPRVSKSKPKPETKVDFSDADVVHIAEDVMETVDHWLEWEGHGETTGELMQLLLNALIQRLKGRDTKKQWDTLQDQTAHLRQTTEEQRDVE
jgi:hypothetical protein